MRVAIVAVALLASSSALARNGGIYLELPLSWGFYSTDEVLIEEGNDDFADFPVSTFVPALKVGVNLFGWAGVEAHATGHFWDLEGDPGGGAYAGGVFRITPLEALTYVIPEDVGIPSLFPAGPVKWRDRPFDLGISFGGGYTLIGEDYAYQGGYFQWGFDVKWFITPNFAIGLDFPFRHPLYEPFRYADYADRTGYCTDGRDAFGPGGFSVPDNASRSFPQFSATDIDRECDEAAPTAFFFAPAITVAGVFDFGI